MNTKLSKNELIILLKKYFSKKTNLKINNVYLFGSFAEDDQSKKSDIDLIIIYHSNKKFFDRYLDFVDIYEIIDKDFDLLTYTIDEWENIKERKFFKNIMKKSIKII